MTHRRFALRLGALAFELEEKTDEPPPSFDINTTADELEPTGIKPTLAKTQPVEQRRKAAGR
jgi:hypothetical protein